MQLQICTKLLLHLVENLIYFFFPCGENARRFEEYIFQWTLFWESLLHEEKKKDPLLPQKVDSLMFLVCLWNVRALLLLEKGLKTWVSNTVWESLNDQTTIYLETDRAA